MPRREGMGSFGIDWDIKAGFGVCWVGPEQLLMNWMIDVNQYQ